MASSRTRILTPFLKEWIDGATVQKVSDTSDPNFAIDSRTSAESGTGNSATGFAWSLYELVFKLLTNIIPLAPRVFAEKSSSGRDSLTVREKDQMTLKESAGRLFLWGDGLCDGRLDSVLDESDDLKQTVVDSLTTIGNALLFIIVVDFKPFALVYERQEIRQQVQQLNILLEKAKLITETEDENYSIPNLEEDSSCHDLESAINSLKTSVKCLMDLLPSIAKTLDETAKANDESQVVSLANFHVSGPAKSYVLNVYDRFTKADKHLVERLGEANWQRHTALRLALGQQRIVLESPDGIQEAPKSLFIPVSMFHDSGLGSSHAQSSYAATVASHSSFVSSIADNENSGVRVPSTPKEVFEGVPFNCDICGHLLTRIKNRIDWRRHVFADLKPYICTFPNCKDELHMFPTRKLWEEHEFNKHRMDRSWKCSDCSKSFEDPDKLRVHLENFHRTTFTNKQYRIVASKLEIRIPRLAESEECPLCLCIPGKTRRNFVTHLGKHMEGIALAALPRESTADSGNDSDLELNPEAKLDSETSTIVLGGTQVPESQTARPRSENHPNPGLKVVSSKKHHDAYGYTHLARACFTGKLDVAKNMLEECPEDLDFPDYAGNTPLQIASLYGHEEIVALLLDAGCDIDCVNNIKDTPLIDAVENGHLGVIKLLLGAGVNPRKVNATGAEPLDLVSDNQNNASEIRDALKISKKTPLAKNRNRNSRKYPADGSAQSTQTLKCLICGETGHNSRDCLSSDDLACQICNQVGHDQSDCVSANFPNSLKTPTRKISASRGRRAKKANYSTSQNPTPNADIPVRDTSTSLVRKKDMSGEQDEVAVEDIRKTGPDKSVSKAAGVKTRASIRKIQ